MVVDELLRIASLPQASARVRGAAEAGLRQAADTWKRAPWPGDSAAVQLRGRIERFLARDHDRGEPIPAPRRLPPGSPIGCSQG